MDSEEQQAQLRMVVRGSGGAALLMFADVDGPDIYVGASLSGRVDLHFKHSYHETGRRHTYTPVGRFSAIDDVPPQELTGFRLLSQRASGVLEWGYKVKPDSDYRRTLILDESDMPNGACIMAFALEPERTSLVEQVLNGSMFVGTEIAGSVISDWTSPHLLLIALRALTPTPSPVPGFVMGPPPGTKITWQLMGKVDASGNVTHLAPKDS